MDSALAMQCSCEPCIFECHSPSKIVAGSASSRNLATMPLTRLSDSLVDPCEAPSEKKNTVADGVQRERMLSPEAKLPCAPVANLAAHASGWNVAPVVVSTMCVYVCMCIAYVYIYT